MDKICVDGRTEVWLDGFEKILRSIERDKAIEDVVLKGMEVVKVRLDIIEAGATVDEPGLLIACIVDKALDDVDVGVTAD